MKDPQNDHQKSEAKGAAHSETKSSGVAQFSAPPYSISSGSDDNSIDILGSNQAALDDAKETADRMIEDAGGLENLNDLFGPNFGSDYQDLLTRMYSYEDEFDLVLSIEGLPQAALDDLDLEYSKLLNIEESITNIVFDNSHLDDVDEETITEVNKKLTEGVIRMNLVETIHEFYMTLEANKILELLSGIEGGMLKGIEKLKEEFSALENDLIAVRNELWNAKKDFAKAGLETFVDAALAGIGISLVVCGSMTPGVNAVLFIGGLAAGALLARGDDNGTPGLVSVGSAKGSIATANLLSKDIQNLHIIPKNIKDPKLLAQIAKEEGKVAGGFKAVPVLNGVLSLWDLKNNVDDTNSEKENMYRIEGLLRNLSRTLDKKLATIVLLESMLKNMAGFFSRLETALENSSSKLDSLSSEIQTYYKQLEE